MIVAALLACSGDKDQGNGTPTVDQDPVAILESFAFEWEFFNHRLSHLEVKAEPDGALVSIIGGTSTTYEPRGDLPDDCTSACDEFPFRDQSVVEVGVRVLESDTVALIPVEVTLEVGRDGGEATLSADVPDGVRGAAAVLLRGFAVDMDHETSAGPTCYAPRFGWHPSLLRLSLGDAVVSDGRVEAPVEVAFAAGNTHDPNRVCIDEVNEDAVVTYRVDAVFLVGPEVAARDVDFTVAEAYDFSGVPGDPGEQPLPDDTTLGFGLTAAASTIVGLDWTFYPDVYGTGDDEQGAYLRTLAFGAQLDGTARANTTNYSPGTQLEGFSYEVRAVARAVEADVTSEGFTVSGTLETALDAGEPVVHELVR